MRTCDVNEAKILDPGVYIVRIDEAAAMCGMTRKGLDNRRLKDPTFPKPVLLTNSSARNAPRGFIVGEVHAWIEMRKELRR
jgi:prophage regulatory protein